MGRTSSASHSRSIGNHPGKVAQSITAHAPFVGVRSVEGSLLLATAVLSATWWRARSVLAQDSANLDSAEIRIGNTTPYTGPAAAYSLIAKTITAYFAKINAEGGVNGTQD